VSGLSGPLGVPRPRCGCPMCQSASAPLWAALTAMAKSSAGQLDAALQEAVQGALQEAPSVPDGTDAVGL
jgi:hypothetical protein